MTPIIPIANEQRWSSDQRATLIALGLNKINRTRVVADDASTRGRIDKVRHLLRVEQVAGQEG